MEIDEAWERRHSLHKEVWVEPVSQVHRPKNKQFTQKFLRIKTNTKMRKHRFHLVMTVIRTTKWLEMYMDKTSRCKRVVIHHITEII